MNTNRIVFIVVLLSAAVGFAQPPVPIDGAVVWREAK